MAVTVAGRDVYVNTQGTQTVKICTPRNARGEYEKYYRIKPPLVLDQSEMEQKVAEFSSLVELERWLVTDRRAQREREKEAPSAIAPPPSGPATTTPPTSPLPPPVGSDTAVELSVEIKRGGILVGVLRTTRSGIIWLPRGQPAGHRLTWAQLEALAAEHGTEVGVR